MSCWGLIQSNVISGNRAEGGNGGGIYTAVGSIIGNTIYGNRAESAAYGVANSVKAGGGVEFRDNIVWDNTDLFGSLNTRRAAGNQVTKSAANDDFDYSAISETVVPSGTGNIGPWATSSPKLVTNSDVGFVSTTLTATGSGYPTYNWGTFLHILETSPLVNRGDPNGDVNSDPDPLDTTNYALRYFRDVDDQVGPLGVVVKQDSVDSEFKDFYVCDIGADEAPTPDNGSNTNSIQWWERF